MTMTLRLHLDSRRLMESLQELRQQRTPRFRQRLAPRVLEQVLSRVVARHPVETGRARDAWSSAAGQLFGGAGRGSKDASAARTDERDRTTVEATNEVDYVVYLEYGTRKMEPRRMVGSALAESPVIVADVTDELVGELLG